MGCNTLLVPVTRPLPSVSAFTIVITVGIEIGFCWIYISTSAHPIFMLSGFAVMGTFLFLFSWTSGLFSSSFAASSSTSSWRDFCSARTIGRAFSSYITCMGYWCIKARREKTNNVFDKIWVRDPNGNGVGVEDVVTATGVDALGGVGKGSGQNHY